MKNYNNPYEAPKITVNGDRFNYIIDNQNDKFLGLIATNDGWYDTDGNKMATEEYVDNAIENVKIETDTEMSDTSEKPVQNKVIKAYVDNKDDYYILVDYDEAEAEAKFRSTFEEIFDIFENTRKNLVIKFAILSNSSQSQNTTYYMPLKSYEYANNDTFIFESVIQTINKNIVITCSRFDGWSLIYEDIPYVDKEYVDGLVDEKADKSTTLAGYGITDAYTKTEVNGLITGDIPITVDVDDEMSDTSENAVQNKVIKSYVDETVERIKYYGDADIVPTSDEYFTFTEISDDVVILGYSITIKESTNCPETVVIPYKYNGYLVTNIEDYAFQECYQLKTLIMPHSITYLGSMVFLDTGLTDITLSNNLTFIDSSGFAFTYIENIVLPDKVTTIQEDAFYGSSLKNITIPNSVAYIHENAFRGLSDLIIHCYKGSYAESFAKSMGIDIEYIDADAYKDYVDEITERIKYYEDASIIPTSDEYFTFTLLDDGYSIAIKNKENCPENIVIPYKYNELLVTAIGVSAFSNCDNLTTVTIPDSVTTIGHNAFYRCTSLASVTIPDSVTTIGIGVFYLVAENFTIKGYINSYAETYAKDNNIPFVYIGADVDKEYVDDAIKNVKIETDTEMSDTSDNAVQNKVIKAYVDGLVGDIETLLGGI